VHYLYAAAAGALAGALTDFSVKKWWVFHADEGKLKGQAFRYALVSAASAGLNCLLAYGLVAGLGAPEIPGVIAASIVIGFSWNYPMHRLYVFGRRYSPT
jgi:putative flippase GtrA